MERKQLTPRDMEEDTRDDTDQERESAPDSVARQFYTKLTKRADVRELLKRLAK